MVARSTQRLTRRQQRLAEKGTVKLVPTIKQQHFDLEDIYPITNNQVITFDAYDEGKNLFLHGSPGTGKSFLSVYLALKEIFEYKSNMQKLVIVRSAQASKNIGFLPGNKEEKMSVYEAPYKTICSELFKRGDAYEILKQKGIIVFETTSFLRGVTIDNAIILIDEAQNSSYMELKTVLTRTGENSKIIVCGDIRQDDLTSERFNEKSGLPELMKVFDKMSSVSAIQFGVDDIVRSGFVKEFIIAENKISFAG